MYYAWVERRGAYESYDTLVIQLFLRELAGIFVEDLMQCAIREYEGRGRRLHIYTRDLVGRLRLAGYHLIAISGSPQEILNVFLKPLGFERSWGTILARDAADCYTGEQIVNPFENKRKVLEEYLEGSSLTLAGSVGVGGYALRRSLPGSRRSPDSLNPNTSLFDVAWRLGWPIVVGRKDVIYNLRTCLKDPVFNERTRWVG